MSAAAQEKGPTVLSIVKDVWEAHDGDMPGAVDALYAEITSRPDVLNSILPAVVRAWCRDQVGGYAGKLRIAAIAPVTDPARGDRLRVAIAATLFDFPLPGGKRLGDANANEIREGAAAYERSAADASHKARWLGVVAQRVGRKNRAENAMTLPQLEALFEETKNV